MISVYLAAKEMFGKTTSNKKSHDTEQWLSQIHIAMCQHRECAPLQVNSGLRNIYHMEGRVCHGV